jgi:glutamate carboxypeptidase
LNRLDAALEAASRRTGDGFSLLRRWVEQNSHTGAVENVNRMGSLLEEAFALPELELTRRAGNGFGDHLGWKTPAWSTDRARRILLVGHHDTVFPPGSFEGLSERDGTWSGPGVLDMKGGIASVWIALGALSEAGCLSELPLAFVSVGDEEVGSIDSRPFTRSWAEGARAALVFEAGRPNDAIITQRKGTGSVRIIARGKAAHAGNQHADGINAIWALARMIDSAQALTDYDRGITVNVGVVAGGTSKNTVPAEAECTLDFRIERADDAARVTDALAERAKSVEAELGAGIELSGGLVRPPWERADGSVALCRRYAEHARAEGLGESESPLIGGGSDANDVGALGVPVIDGLGPRGRGFHTPSEHIERDTLPRRAAALVRFLLAESGLRA